MLLFATEYAVGQRELKFGILFDPTVMWYQSNNKNVTSEKAHLGFNFGMSLDYYFANNYAFATGISLFNTRSTVSYANGIELKISGKNMQVTSDDDVKYRIQYIKIPVGLKFKTHKIGRYVYFANLGLNPMVRVSAKADFISEEKEYSKEGVNKEVNFLNIGWHFGGGTTYSLGGEAAIFAGLSFMSTFSSTLSRDVITSRNLSLRIGVLF